VHVRLDVAVRIGKCRRRAPAVGLGARLSTGQRLLIAVGGELMKDIARKFHPAQNKSERR
jgi:hypothetical protein